MFELAKNASLTAYTNREVARLMYDALLKQQDVSVEIKSGAPDNDGFVISIVCQPPTERGQEPKP